MGRLLPCKQAIGVQLPGSPLSVGSVAICLYLTLRKVAGYGWPGLGANECALRGMGVRIPHLPLLTQTSMVKRIIIPRFERGVPGSSPGRGASANSSVESWMDASATKRRASSNSTRDRIIIEARTVRKLLWYPSDTGELRNVSLARTISLEETPSVQVRRQSPTRTDPVDATQRGVAMQKKKLLIMLLRSAA
jgi:hypothetical protein